MSRELYDLLKIRLLELGSEMKESGCAGFDDGIREYFLECFEFAGLLCEAFEYIGNNPSIEGLKEYNFRLYDGIRANNYKTSYVNPKISGDMFGPECGRILSAIAAELRGAIPAVYRGEVENLTMRIELLLEIYSAYKSVAEDLPEGEVLNSKCSLNSKILKKILYDYVYDYMEVQTKAKLSAQLIPGDSKWTEMISDMDENILYYTGEYVGENELKMFNYLTGLNREEVKAMADTYIGGYVKGFEVTGRNLKIKDTAELRFNIGFLPMIKYSCEILEKINIKPTFVRAGYSIFTGRSVDKNGYFGANPNPQYDYDHKDDLALVIDEKLNERRIECLEKAFEEFATPAKVFAGPAVIDIFGEEEFVPENKPEAVQSSDSIRKLITDYAAKAGALTNKYIPGDERSFTIIAFPMPSIGDNFEEIFKDTIRINTLDYTLYRDIQQTIIDSLDRAEYVCVKGMNNNKTDLLIHLHVLDNPASQTNFENCVADVNIPVGEVFTSPLLEGTNGILNVCKVFLNGLEYNNLTLEIKDGKIKNYFCDVFDKESGEKNSESGRKMIEDNILFHHETLPMGECAIGTNTTAFAVARKHGIESKLPILIAEKTGPHFAFGDTCYSHCEDLAVYNPDGKEIIARDNEISLLRKKDPQKAYFNCHTDITIPYDELGEVSALKKDGEKIIIIKDGKFVLDGCEELNNPLKTLIIP